MTLEMEEWLFEREETKKYQTIEFDILQPTPLENKTIAMPPSLGIHAKIYGGYYETKPILWHLLFGEYLIN